MDLLEQVQLDLQPSKELVGGTNVPLLVLVDPTLGELVLGRVVRRADVVVALGAG